MPHPWITEAVLNFKCMCIDIKRKAGCKTVFKINTIITSDCDEGGWKYTG